MLSMAATHLFRRPNSVCCSSHDTMKIALILHQNVRWCTSSRSRPDVSSNGGNAAAFLQFTRQRNLEFNGGLSSSLQHDDQEQHSSAPQQQQDFDSNERHDQQSNKHSKGSHHRQRVRGKVVSSMQQQHRSLPFEQSLVAVRESAAKLRQGQNYEKMKQEIAEVVRRLRQLRNQLPQRGNSAALLETNNLELIKHNVSLESQSLLSRLHQRHFDIAEPASLITLLHCIQAMELHAGYIVTSALSRLVREAHQLSGRSIVAILNIISDETVRGLTNAVAEDATRSLLSLLLFPSNEGGGSSSMFHDVHPSSLCKLLHRSISPDTTNVVLQGMSKELVVAVVAYFMGDKTRMKTLELGHMVVLSRAIAHHRVPNKEALEFLAALAPRVQEEVLFLSARQISQLLLSYAMVGYREPQWFIVLGQRAGEVGERMSEDDAAGVLHAFSLVGIEHDKLRNSLESSMRLKHVRRTPLFHRVF